MNTITAETLDILHELMDKSKRNFTISIRFCGELGYDCVEEMVEEDALRLLGALAPAKLAVIKKEREDAQFHAKDEKTRTDLNDYLTHRKHVYTILETQPGIKLMAKKTKKQIHRHISTNFSFIESVEEEIFWTTFILIFSREPYSLPAKSKMNELIEQGITTVKFSYFEDMRDNLEKL